MGMGCLYDWDDPWQVFKVDYFSVLFAAPMYLCMLFECGGRGSFEWDQTKQTFKLGGSLLLWQYKIQGQIDSSSNWEEHIDVGKIK